MRHKPLLPSAIRNLGRSRRHLTRREVRALSQHFGGIAPYRILLDPWPGTATERHLLDKLDRENRRVEIVDRTLIEKPLGAWRDHVSFTLAYWLDLHVASRRRGLVSGSRERRRVTSEDPDVYFVERPRRERRFRGNTVRLVPKMDIAAFVVESDVDRQRIHRRLRLTFGVGARLAWTIDLADHTVAVYTSPETPDVALDRAATLTGGDVLPGFTLDLAAFWAQFCD